MFKPISTRVHGVLDYLTVGTYLALPRLLGCNRTFTRAVTTVALAKLGYAMMSRHELGVVKLIPMKTHLALDCLVGATMAALPFTCEESEDPATVASFVGMGLFDIAAAPLTQTQTARQKRGESVRGTIEREPARAAASYVPSRSSQIPPVEVAASA